MNQKCLSYIGGSWYEPSGEIFQSWDPITNSALHTGHACTKADVNEALQTAQTVATNLQQRSGSELANFLNTLAGAIEALGDELIETAMGETGLPEARLQGERARTCGQIRAFAELVKEGSWVKASIDTAQPDRSPLPKPDVRSLYAAIGPVAVFGASNFPFAFGTLGGDTASALAGGNPVILKGHPSHPATSTLFTKAADTAIKHCGFPEGTVSLLQGHTNELGSALVDHPLTAAVGFTGSVAVGRALMDIAARRPKPIMVYAEMGSINPVFVMPDALKSCADSIASGLATSIAMGAGQFCTSPGLIVTLKGNFANKVAEQLALQPKGFMLNLGIAEALNNAIEERSLNNDIQIIIGGIAADNILQPNNTLMKVGASDFLDTPALLEELFGPVSLFVECDSIEQMQQIAEHMEGNLTATIHTDTYNDPAVEKLLTTLSNQAGRVLFNGYPTGVEVCPSMNHGGSYPASSTPATTSVGTAAVYRFTRRIAFQNCPNQLLPPALQDGNPLDIWRQINGEFTKNIASTQT